MGQLPTLSLNEWIALSWSGLGSLSTTGSTELPSWLPPANGQAERTKQITEIIRPKKTGIKTPRVYRHSRLTCPAWRTRVVAEDNGMGPSPRFSCLRANAQSSRDNPKGCSACVSLHSFFKTREATLVAEASNFETLIQGRWPNRTGKRFPKELSNTGAISVPRLSWICGGAELLGDL